MPEENDTEPFHATYPIDAPPQTHGITRLISAALETPAPESPFIGSNDDILAFEIALGKHTLSTPSEQVKSVVYNKTTGCVVAEATAFGHQLLREWLLPFESDTQIRLLANVYEVTPTTAWQATRRPWSFSSDGMEPFLKIENTILEGTMTEKIRERDDGTFISVKFDPQTYSEGFKTESSLDVRFQRFPEAPTVALQAWSRFNSEYPNIYALGQSDQHPEKILLAAVQIYPVSSNGEMVIDGRICQQFSDHENFRFSPMMSHLAARLENGTTVYRMTIPKDFFPKAGDNAPSDPFAVDLRDEADMPELTSNPFGIHPDTHELTDPSEYFISRGMPFRPNQDWMAYDPQTSTLYYQLPDTARALLEVLVNNSTGCFFPNPPTI